MHPAGAEVEPDLSPAVLQARLQRCLSEHAGAEVVVSGLHRCSSGFSWLTYAFEAALPQGPRELILQLGTPAGLLAPYTAEPQARVLHALAGSAVPVAGLVTWGDDASVLGAPYLVMHKMPGVDVVPWDLDVLPQPVRRGLAEQMIDALAALHSNPAATAALRPLHPEVSAANAAVTEVRAWDALMARWCPRSLPLLTWASQWLRRHAPAAPRLCVAHGDFRLGNFLQQQGRVTAVLDWELVHLGHPHEDLGWLLLPMYNKGSKQLFQALPRAEALARYTERSGVSVDASSLHYFECLATYRSVGVLLAGWSGFLRRGQNDMRMVAMFTQVPALCRHLEKLIEAAP